MNQWLYQPCLLGFVGAGGCYHDSHSSSGSLRPPRQHLLTSSYFVRYKLWSIIHMCHWQSICHVMSPAATSLLHMCPIPFLVMCCASGCPWAPLGAFRYRYKPVDAGGCWFDKLLVLVEQEAVWVLHGLRDWCCEPAGSARPSWRQAALALTMWQGLPAMGSIAICKHAHVLTRQVR